MGFFGGGAKCVLSSFPLGLSRILKADGSRAPERKSTIRIMRSPQVYNV